MIGNSISVNHVETNSYQSQLIIRQVVTQDCVKDCVPHNSKIVENLPCAHGGFNCTGTHPECRPMAYGSVRFYTFIIKKYIGENDVWYYMSVILNLYLKVCI